MRGVKGTGPFGQKKGTKKASKKARRQAKTNNQVVRVEFDTSEQANRRQRREETENQHHRYGGDHPHSDCIAEAASADTLLSLALTVISVLRKIPILRLQHSDVHNLQEVTDTLSGIQEGLQEIYGDLPTSAYATEEEEEVTAFDPRRTQPVSPGQLMRLPGPFGDILRMMSQAPMRPMRTNKSPGIARGARRAVIENPEYIER